jgi:tRNA C32,U32 (ribose-2'-O)-methylase TrmJ
MKNKERLSNAAESFERENDNKNIKTMRAILIRHGFSKQEAEEFLGLLVIEIIAKVYAWS